MKDKVYLVITSIAAPNEILQNLAAGCAEREYHFIVIGDEPSPSDFHIDDCEFYDLQRQSQTGLRFAHACPTNHYARKNIGYLLAMCDDASLIVETDDDNIPYDSFWTERQRQQKVQTVENAGWTNIYSYFSDKKIWPRGFPLDKLQSRVLPYESLTVADVDCPIQQGLADDDPDVDAVYRLTLPLPQTFRKNRRIALTAGSRCPFNSQNTTWWPDAFPLLYLPSICSFRTTDIWRSFIAQKIAHLNDWAILFHEPTMTQRRNAHNLLQDFEDEIPGYLHNSEICQALDTLPLQPGPEKIADNLRACYEKLVSMSLLDPEELYLLDAWLDDIDQLQ